MEAKARRAKINRGTREDEIEREKAISEEAQYNEQVESLSRQLDLLKQKQQKLKIVSPVDGIITTWDFERELLSRPVKPGDSLLTVANDNGPWELELDAPEDRAGYIMKQRITDPDMPVTYHLATEPGGTYEGVVVDVHESAEVHGEEGSTVLVRVKVDKDQHPNLLLPGAGVKARLYCGRSSVGWWLFHDAIGFIESRVLFPMNM